MEFSVKTGKVVIRVEARTHESALVKYLMARRRPLLGMKDRARAGQLLSELPRKVAVSGNAAKSYEVKGERVGKKKFPGSRCVFSVEESRLGRVLGALGCPQMRSRTHQWKRHGNCGREAHPCP